MLRHLTASLALGCLLAAPAVAAPPKGGKTVKRAKTIKRGKTIRRGKKAGKTVKRGKGGKTVAQPKQDVPLTPAQQTAWRTALNAARAAQKAGQLAEAIRQFDAALAIYPDDARAMGERGWARYKQADYKGAEADLMAALARSGDSRLRGSQLYNLGRVHEAAGRIDAAIASYRASQAVRPHIAVRKRLEALTKAPVTALGIAPAVRVTDLAPLCAEYDDDPKDDETPECAAGEAIAKLGDASVSTYAVRSNIGEAVTHLLFDVAGARYVVKNVHTEYNPGAFGIFEETEFFRVTVDGDTLVMHARKHRSDSDMGINEIEVEVTESMIYCGLVKGVPHCTQGLLTSYDGSREILHTDVKDGIEAHDLWASKWALSVTREGKTLKVGNAGGALPKGPAALVGSHPLPW